MDTDKKFDRKAYMKKYNASYRKKHTEKFRKYNLDYKQKNSEEIKKKRSVYRSKKTYKIAQQTREIKLKTRYKITKAEYDLLCASQDFCCSICGRQVLWPERLNVDHDHKTKEIRGLLCGNCNRALGLLHDDIKSLKRAIIYLKKFKKI